MRSLAFLALATAALAGMIGGAAADARQVTISGCARAGIENGCIMITGDDGTYNITDAEPAPKAGTYGTVAGTVFDGLSLCMEGAILKPATWTADPAKPCPADGAQ